MGNGLRRRWAEDVTDLLTAIGADDEQWEVALIGKNLTNKYTKAYENDLPGAAGSFFGHILRGRSFAGQVTMKF